MTDEKEAPAPPEVDHRWDDVTGELKTVHVLLGEIVREMGGVAKSGRNEDQNYRFRSVEDMTAAFHAACETRGVFVVPKLRRRKQQDRVTSNGRTMIYVALEQGYRFYGPRGDYVDAVVPGEANDTQDKAANKALSAAYKYLIAQTFSVPTEGVVQDGDASGEEAGTRATGRRGRGRSTGDTSGGPEEDTKGEPRTHAQATDATTDELATLMGRLRDRFPTADGVPDRRAFVEGLVGREVPAMAALSTGERAIVTAELDRLQADAEAPFTPAAT